jgi:hypothetical protein
MSDLEEYCDLQANKYTQHFTEETKDVCFYAYYQGMEDTLKNLDIIIHKIGKSLLNEYRNLPDNKDVENFTLFVDKLDELVNIAQNKLRYRT